MDNDRNIKNEWKRAGYDRIRTKVYSTEWKLEGEELVITSAYSIAAVSLQRSITGTMTWTVSANGTITVTVEGDRKPLHPHYSKIPMPELPFLPRFGLRLFLSAAYEQVSYFGYGPRESYIDKHRNSYLDLFCTKSDTAKQYVQKWMPIVAASQSVKGNEKEREFLLSWVNVVDYE